GHIHASIVGLCFLQCIRIIVCCQIIDGILSFFGGELLAILGGQLVIDALLGHIHAVAVILSFCQRIGLVVSFQIVDRILSRFCRKLFAVLRGQLVIDSLL